MKKELRLRQGRRWLLHSGLVILLGLGGATLIRETGLHWPDFTTPLPQPNAITDVPNQYSTKARGEISDYCGLESTSDNSIAASRSNQNGDYSCINNNYSGK